MRNLLKKTIATALLAGTLVLSGEGAKAATASITSFYTAKIINLLGIDATEIRYDWQCSWSGTGRTGVGSIKWYQNNALTAYIMDSYYTSTPVSVSGYVQDIPRPLNINNYYKGTIYVRSTSNPSTVFAQDSRTDPGP